MLHHFGSPYVRPASRSTSGRNSGIGIKGFWHSRATASTIAASDGTLHDNYFVYKKYHYLYQDGWWLRARRHDGPWTVIPIAKVPGPILAVPVERYPVRPTHWAQHGPPPWKHERDREQRREHERGRGHDGDKGHDDRGHGKGHK